MLQMHALKYMCLCMCFSLVWHLKPVTHCGHWQVTDRQSLDWKHVPPFKHAMDAHRSRSEKKKRCNESVHMFHNSTTGSKNESQNIDLVNSEKKKIKMGFVYRVL